MKNPLRALGLIALLVSLATLSACALFQKHVDAVDTDVKSCVSVDAPQAIKDIESAAGPLLVKVLLCAAADVISGDAAALPACANVAISGVETAVGPDGARFAECVYVTVKNDPNALAEQKARASLAIRKIQAERS